VGERKGKRMPRDAPIHRGLTSGWTAGEMGPTVGHLVQPSIFLLRSTDWRLQRWRGLPPARAVTVEVEADGRWMMAVARMPGRLLLIDRNPSRLTSQLRSTCPLYEVRRYYVSTYEVSITPFRDRSSSSLPIQTARIQLDLCFIRRRSVALGLPVS
jgi:hypothetical protein